MKRSFSLNLWQKALILITIPLAFEIVFLVVLDNLLTDTERKVEYAETSRQISEKATMIAKLTYDGLSALFDYQKGGNVEDAQQRYERAVTQLPIEFEALWQKVQNRPEEREIAERLIQSATRQLKLMEMGRRLIERHNIIFDAAIAAKIYSPNNPLSHIAADLDALTAIEDKNAANSDIDLESRRATRRIWMTAGIAFNIFLAVGLAAMFHRGTISRLAILMDNTRRFASKKPLHPPLPNADEIGQIDYVFHDMARTINEVEQMKQEFYGMISHDLRTPLTSVLGTFGLLEKGNYGQLNEAGQARVVGAEKSVRRLIKLINEVLDLEKITANKFELMLEEVYLDDVVQDSIEAVQEIADEARIAIISKPSNLTITADGERLTQVLVNLLSNALKFSPENSTVHINVDNRVSQGDVLIEVLDEGRGVPDEMKNAIFERFKQISVADSRVARGAGLGLSICKSVVEQHGGTIGVTDNKPTGSRFWFTVSHQNSRSE